MVLSSRASISSGWWPPPRSFGIGRVSPPVGLAEWGEDVPQDSVRPGLTGLVEIYAPRDIPRKHKFT